MTTETMTIHKALCELKVLDDRIGNAINECPFVFANQHSNAKVGGVPIEDYKADIKSKYQSITDLLRRRAAIKAAVIASNAQTKVQIGGREYTVAGAIEMKNKVIPTLKYFLSTMTSKYKRASTAADRENGQNLEDRADAFLKSVVGTSDIKGATEEVKKMRADFIEQHTYEVVDPIGIVEKSAELEKMISGFIVDVDSALSVSNATTSISIEY